MGWIYVYEENGFTPDNISHLGYTFSRSQPIEVDEETANKLRTHPHFKCLLGNGPTHARVSVADAITEVSDENNGTEELTSKEKKAAYMRKYMQLKRASK